MTYDRQEYLDLVEEKLAKSINGQRAGLEAIQQAAVKAENLTGDPLWDTYLSYVQAGIERMEMVRDACLEKLGSSSLVDQNQIMATKVALAEAKAMIEAWQAVLSLPKDLKENGGKAEEFLARLDA